MDNKVKSKKSSRVKIELKVFIVCLIAALGLVLYAVFGHNKGMSEFVSQLHIVLLGALAIYFLSLAFRVVFWILYKIVN